MKCTVDYIIAKLEKIPEENWLVREYGNPDKGCAMGLCSNDMPAHEFLFHARDWLGSTKECTPMITINNGEHPNYQQPTPKQRILAALYDIKKLQQPNYADATAEIIEKFKPSEDTPDKIIKPIPIKI